MLSGDAVHLKDKQESTALQLQSMVTQLKCESFGLHKFEEQGKDVFRSVQRLWTLGPNCFSWNLSTAT